MGGSGTSRPSGRVLGRIGALSYRWRFWILGVWALALAAFFPTLRALDHQSAGNAAAGQPSRRSEMPISRSHDVTRHAVGTISSGRGANRARTAHGQHGSVLRAGQSTVAQSGPIADEPEGQTIVSMTPSNLFPALNPMIFPTLVPQPAPGGVGPAPTPPAPGGGNPAPPAGKDDEKGHHESKGAKHGEKDRGTGPKDTRGFKRDESKRDHRPDKGKGKGKDRPRGDGGERAERRAPKQPPKHERHDPSPPDEHHAPKHHAKSGQR